MSSDGPLKKIAALADDTKRTHPGARVEFMTFDSGSAMLDVVRDGRLFILAYSTTHRCFGVDEVLDDEGFLLGYRFVYDEFEPAAQRLRELIASKEPLNESTTPLISAKPLS